MIRRILFTSLLTSPVSLAGPYSPAGGAPGSEAIHRTDSRIVKWASGFLPVEYGTEVDSEWKTPAKAIGPAADDVYHIVCLGNGGRITMYFPNPIRDGAGADFAVFENAFNHTFLELAFVEVSSDGSNFFRFSSTSLTPSVVGAFGSVDPTNVDGLAGKYKVGYGTPFDLDDLAVSPLLDKQRIRFVRIVDIIGDGATKDSANRPIYDPTPTVGSGGFDLDAIGVIHQNDGPFRIMKSQPAETDFEIEWESNPGSRYRLETSVNMSGPSDWTPLREVNGSTTSGVTSLLTPKGTDPRRFWRLVRID
jgi:hypothetical protein